MEDKKIQLSLNLVNAVLNYFGTRPYGEVWQMIQAIQQEAAPQVQPAEQAPLND